MSGRKTGGRRVGSLNKATVEAKAACCELVDDPEYRARLRERLLDGTMMNQWINSARLNLESRSMRDRLRWPLLIASLPLWPILSLVAFGALARVKLGFWPAYDHPDPSTLHWPFFEVPMFPLLLLTVGA
jgi:hypothetical protein